MGNPVVREVWQARVGHDLLTNPPQKSTDEIKNLAVKLFIVILANKISKKKVQ